MIFRELDEWTRDQQVRVLDRARSGNYTKEELEQCSAFLAAKCMRLEVLLKYVLKDNKNLLKDADAELAKTGLLSSERSHEDTVWGVEILDAGIKISKKNSARVSAKASHEEDAEAKKWVQTEWSEHSAEHGDNKTEFARIYVRLIAQKFKNKKGDPLIRSEIFIKNALPKINNPGRKKKII